MYRFRFLLFAFLFSTITSGIHAQDMDFLKHRKSFDICSIKRECTECFNCEKDRYVAKIQNNSDKKIVGVYFKYYSPVFKTVIEKEAKIEGNKINGKQIGHVHVCVLDGRHWIFSKIEYEDQSTTTFTLQDPIQDFLQEADECDCND